MKNVSEKLMHGVFLISAAISIIAVILICMFLFANGLPAILEIGPLNFLGGFSWKPNDIPASYGIFPMIIGSLYVTAVAILFGVPIGILSALYMAYFCPKKLHSLFKQGIDLLAGIPSVVYGFFGIVVMVPFVKTMGRSLGLGGNGFSILTAGLLLAMMILPTIISVSEAALRALPSSYYEASLALGATHERSVFKICLNAAKSGILSSVILGIGRAIGETMTVVMIAGNQPWIPNSIFKGARTLTANIILEMGYAADLHREALIATGVVLFVFILFINGCFAIVKRKV